MVLHMLDLLSTKRKYATGDDTAAGDDAANSGGKNKGNAHDETVDFQRLDATREGKNITLKADEEAEQDEYGRKKTFQLLPATPLHLVDKESEKSNHRVNLYSTNFEIFGSKDDFRLNRSYMTPWGLLCLDLPPELLQNAEMPLIPPPVDIQVSLKLFPRNLKAFFITVLKPIYYTLFRNLINQ